jgi:hypothetical protein
MLEPAELTLDPGDAIRTPLGTGRLGNPFGNGLIWAAPGNSAPLDGTESAGTADYPGGPVQDGTGSR